VQEAAKLERLNSFTDVYEGVFRTACGAVWRDEQENAQKWLAKEISIY
jgi:hypothetical protein